MRPEQALPDACVDEGLADGLLRHPFAEESLHVIGKLAGT